jgi:hypothetical protein
MLRPVGSKSASGVRPACAVDCEGRSSGVAVLSSAWNQWRIKPRKPLSEWRGRTSVVFVFPLILLGDAVRRAFNLTHDEQLAGRLMSIPYAIIGLVLLYVTWIYFKRPVSDDY